MFLYKYIGFEKSHWSEPYLTNSFYFPTMAELKKGNDKEEFNHKWLTSSSFLASHTNEILKVYTHLFENARVLCLGKNYNQSCWNSFCEAGGICYEFKFDSKSTAQELTHESVIYNDVKELNGWSYFIQNVTDRRISNILKKEDALNLNEQSLLLNWFKGHEPRDIGVSHILNELTFKKTRKFRHEKEYRFVHIEDVFEKIKLKTKFNNGRLGVDVLGLSLCRIFTSDEERVRDTIKNPNLTIQLSRFR